MAALILAITTAIVYRGALDNQFVDWDDYTYVTENNLEANIIFFNLYNSLRSCTIILTTSNQDLFCCSNFS